MDESFHFALLRVSIAQILKANGFEKCKPSVLNILTDIYLQYFKNLIQEALKCSQLRTRSNNVGVQDINEALRLIEAIKPENYLQLDDTYDNEKLKESSLTKHTKAGYNTKSLDSFVNWIYRSDSYRVGRKLNELPNGLIKNLIEKRKLDLDDGETDQEKKKRKYKERQDYYNQLKLSELHGDVRHEEDDEDDLTASDKLSWLNYLIEKDLRLGHDLKFINSNLMDEFLKFQSNLKFHPVMKGNGSSDNEVYRRYKQFQHHIKNFNKYDYVVINLEDDAENETEEVSVTPSEELIKLLPYNIKYDESLLDDDLEQYIEYSEKNVEELPDHSYTIKQDAFVDDPDIHDDGVGGDNNLMFL